MHIGIAIYDHTGIEEIFGIEDVFDLLHDAVSSGTPFHFDVGGHIPAGSVFGFKGTVVFFNHHPADFIHKAPIPLHFFLG